MKKWIIPLIVMVIYGISVFGEFVQDDLKVVVSDPEMGSVNAVVSAFVRPYYYMDKGNPGIYRPVTSASLYLNALITGREAWGFRLGNVLLYAAVCWLVGEVLEKLKVKKPWVWTLVFTVLPVHTEAVNNIVGRAEILSLGLVLVAVLFQIKKRWEWSALIFLLALLSKETAVVGLAVLMYLLWTSDTDRETKWGVSAFYLMALGGYWVMRLIVLGTGAMGNEATIVENPLKFLSADKRVMNAFALVPFGLSKIIFPWHLSYDYSFNQLKLVTSWFDWRVMLGVLMVLGSVGSLLTKLRNNKIWILGQAFFWGPIVVTGNFLFPIGTIFGERLWFWPSFGVIIITASLISFRPHSLLATDNPASPAEAGHLDTRLEFSSMKKPSNSSLRSVAQRKKDCKEIFSRAFFLKSIKYFGLVLISLLALRAGVRNLDWLSQERLFIHDAAYVKDSVMAQSNAAAMYLMKGDWETGKKYMEKASASYPKYPELLNNWGLYYFHEGDKDKAEEMFKKCLEERSEFSLCEGNLEWINSLE